MEYRIFADVVVVTHLLGIIYGLLGGLLYFWRHWLIFVHLPLALWISLIEFFGWICPLTPLENTLRIAGGEAGYNGGFIEHYLIPVIYPPGLTREVELVLGIIALGLNLTIYALVWRNWYQNKHSSN